MDKCTQTNCEEIYHAASLNREKKWRVLDLPSQSPDLNPIEHAFHLKRRLKEKKTTTERTYRKSWKRITKESQNKNATVGMGRRLDGVIASNEYVTKYQVLFTLIH